MGDILDDVVQITADIRKKAFEQAASVILSEVGRLQILQRREFEGARDKVIAALHRQAHKIRKLK